MKNNNPYYFSEANKELKSFISKATKNGASYIHVTPKPRPTSRNLSRKTLFSSYDLSFRTRQFKLSF